jgi:hypothetical protein
MIINKKIKTIVTIILLITAMSFMAGCKSKTSIKGENSTGQTEQSSSNPEEKLQGDNVETKETTIDEWKFDVPEGYKIEENGGPWYEKRYANENGVVLLFGYYAPNGIDNRTDKQIFEEQVNNEEQDLINRYGGGEVTYKDINNDKMYSTIYYETRDLKVLKRSIIKGQVWKTIYIEIPINENEKDYENILDIIK